MISVLLQRWRLSLRLAGNDAVPEHSYVRDKQLHSFYRFYLFKDNCYLRRKDSILTWELYIQ